MIGMQGLGLHVQLSSRQGERGAGQLEEKERDLCHSPCILVYTPTERQRGRETDRPDKNIAVRDITRRKN